MELEDLSAAQLKEYVKENNIDTGGAKTRAAILAFLTGGKAEVTEATEGVDPSETPAPAQTDGPVISGDGVIQAPQRKRNPQSNVKPDEDGVFKSRAADRALSKKQPVDDGFEEEEVEKVALFSKGTIRWQDVGELTKGYNIVTKEAAEKWLTRKTVREATPQEVANFYGK